MSTDVISVENLTKDFKELRAADDLSFQVKEGEILGLLGPNGSGKSTTMNCILSLLKFDKGNIKIFDEEMYRGDEHPDISPQNAKIRHIKNILV